MKKKSSETEKSPDIKYSDDRRSIEIDFDRGEWILILAAVAILGISGCFKWVL